MTVHLIDIVRRLTQRRLVQCTVTVIPTVIRGKTSNAAAMGMTIVATSAGLRALQALAMRGISRRSQAWRHR